MKESLKILSVMTSFLLSISELSAAKYKVLYGEDSIAEEVRAHHGRIVHKLTDRVFVASFPDTLKKGNLSQSIRSSLEDPGNLDEASQFMVRAWGQAVEESRRGREEERPSTLDISKVVPAPWPKGKLPPRNSYNDPILKAQEGSFIPRNNVMSNEIALGIVIVSGESSPGKSDFVFSLDEQNKVVSEVLKGAHFLATAEPEAEIQFKYKIHKIDVKAQPGTNPSDYEAMEAPWRNKALKTMGYNFVYPGFGYMGFLAINALVNEIDTTGRAYISFFTKYPLHHFAYASGPRLVIQYGNDEWGTDDISILFANLSAHIFGAADEYNADFDRNGRDDFKCAATESGMFSIPNYNCVNCTTRPDRCLMQDFTFNLCHYTRGQIGWGWFNWGNRETNRIDSWETNQAPSAVTFRERLWVAHQGKNENGVWLASTYNGRDWSNAERIKDWLTNRSLSMVVFQDKLWMAHTGMDSQIWLASYNGVNWSNAERIQGWQTEKAVSMAVFQDKLWMAHTGKNENGVWLASFDGIGWSEAGRVSDWQTEKAVNMAVFQDKLWMAHAGMDKEIWLASSIDGNHWSAPRTFSGWYGSGWNTAKPVSLAVFDKKLWLAHVEHKNPNRGRIYVSSIEGGNDRYSTHHYSSRAPHLVNFQSSEVGFPNKLYLFFRDSGSHSIAKLYNHSSLN